MCWNRLACGTPAIATPVGVVPEVVASSRQRLQEDLICDGIGTQEALEPGNLELPNHTNLGGGNRSFCLIHLVT